MTGPAAKRQARKKRPKRRPPAAVAAAVDAAQDQAGLNNRVKTGSSNSRRQAGGSSLRVVRGPEMTANNPNSKSPARTSRAQALTRRRTSPADPTASAPDKTGPASDSRQQIRPVKAGPGRARANRTGLRAARRLKNSAVPAGLSRPRPATSLQPAVRTDPDRIRGLPGPGSKNPLLPNSGHLRVRKRMPDGQQQKAKCRRKMTSAVRAP